MRLHQLQTHLKIYCIYQIILWCKSQDCENRQTYMVRQSSVNSHNYVINLSFQLLFIHDKSYKSFVLSFKNSVWFPAQHFSLLFLLHIIFKKKTLNQRIVHNIWKRSISLENNERVPEGDINKCKRDTYILW